MVGLLTVSEIKLVWCCANGHFLEFVRVGGLVGVCVCLRGEKKAVAVTVSENFVCFVQILRSIPTVM